MRIAEVKTTAVRVPLREPVKWSGGTRETAPALIVELYTDEGQVGLGECVGPTIPVIQAIVEEELRDLLRGADPLRTEFLVHKLEEHTVNWAEIARYAIAGLEMALLDLKGKVYGMPVVELLGGVYRREVEFMGYLFIEPPEVNAQQAVEYVQQGFRELKVKVGRDLDEDVARLRAIREAVGPKVKIRVDANMAWSVPTAIKTIRRLEPYGLQFVEQPVPWYDREGLAQVRAAVETPIAADESCTGLREALALIEKRACDVLVVYVSEAGGLTKAQQIVRLADAVGMWCVLGTWAELGVGTIAGVHLVAASRNFPFANDTHYPLQADDVLPTRLTFVQGKLEVPRRPGLGVELDAEKVAYFAQLKARDTVFGDPDDPRFIPRIGQIS
ncbi:MAG TPA: hypothetical protein EYP85_10375 [Armatimonadetes bacterium]|nr:hypothetical protein [Armatimonadota bacterium]